MTQFILTYDITGGHDEVRLALFRRRYKPFLPDEDGGRIWLPKTTLVKSISAFDDTEKALERELDAFNKIVKNAGKRVIASFIAEIGPEGLGLSRRAYDDYLEYERLRPKIGGFGLLGRRG